LLLFIIGFEIDLHKIRKRSGFIFKSATVIIALEAMVGGVVIHEIFRQGWLVSLLVAFSFATVGEAVLVPILDEYGILNSKLGQVLVGLGTVDDLVEVVVLVIAVSLVDLAGQRNIGLVVGALSLLMLVTTAILKFEEQGERFKFHKVETLFLFVLFMLFLFVGIGRWADAGSLGALLAGIVVRNMISRSRLKLIESELKAMCYGLFAPIFFFWVGLSLKLEVLIKYFPYVLVVMAVSAGLKMLGSAITGRKQFSWKEIVLLGTGLSVRFSTSIVIIKILFEHGLLSEAVYGVMVTSSIGFTFLVPIVFSRLINSWRASLRF